MKEGFILALVQARPVYGDKQACLKKMLTLIHEASSRGAHLAAFGETSKR